MGRTKEYLGALERLESAYVRFRYAAESAGAPPSSLANLNQTIVDLARARQIVDDGHHYETSPGLPEKLSEPSTGSGTLGQPNKKLGTEGPSYKLPQDRTPEERDPLDVLKGRTKPSGPGTGVQDFGNDPASSPVIPVPGKATKNDLQAVLDYASNLNEAAGKMAASKPTKDAVISAVYENLAKALDNLAKEIRSKIKQVPTKRPTEDQNTGGLTLKHHEPTPEEKKINSPKTKVPIGDPSGEQTFGPSSVRTVTGQATDPDPNKDNFGVGGQKVIKTTGDAVTDPWVPVISLVSVRFQVVFQ